MTESGFKPGAETYRLRDGRVVSMAAVRGAQWMMLWVRSIFYGGVALAFYATSGWVGIAFAAAVVTIVCLGGMIVNAFRAFKDYE